MQRCALRRLRRVLSGMSVIACGIPVMCSAQDQSIMSDKYNAFWNAEVQAAIDANIEKHRKVDAVVAIDNAKPGTDVKVEQLTHTFRFGGNFFMFGQLDSAEKNQAYADAFGELWNSGTVAFYWKTLEFEPGKPRFAMSDDDTPEFWATISNPKEQRHWRRPPTDPCIDYLESRGLHVHGHAIIYGMRRWGHPEWMPEERKAMEPLFEARVKQLAERYQGRVRSWDVVNECIDQANRGIMPDDYTYKTFRWAQQYFPVTVCLSTNECDMAWGPNRRYVEIVRDLIDRGIRVDLMGVQMHIFNQRHSQSIADGADSHTPEKMLAVLDTMVEAGPPIHISEVTISAPGDDQTGREIQAIIARNLYRLWFSHPAVVAITWWNSVDGGAAPGEPAISGIFDINLKKKPVYHALDQLINHDWKTNLTVQVSEGSKVAFRGFRGKYRITWTDVQGKEKSREVIVQ
ncbi:MAG: endo-1,4-beta-xylanase [Thermoguttaceae bacterium]|nr:endo-1,4-beta-xylanase [Thermoguttaceae bacterium]